MTLTAVQLLDHPRCELLHGRPQVTVVGRRGDVALFEPGELVAYAVRAQRPPRLFVFRTAPAAPEGAAVPGVYPRVRLLLSLDHGRVLRRARRAFLLLERAGLSPTALPDRFYLRLDAVLRSRAPLTRLLRALTFRYMHDPLAPKAA